MRAFCVVAILLFSVLVTPASAGEDPMAAMANCHVCKVMMPHMAELMPVLTYELINLDNGRATLTTITDSEKIGSYHELCGAMHKAGMETASFTKEEAGAKLCPMCQKMWQLMAEGAHLSYGTTATGDLMVLSSEDPEIQAKIAALWKEYEQLMAGG